MPNDSQTVFMEIFLGKPENKLFFLMLMFNWLDCGAFLRRRESLVKGMFAIALV